MASQEYDLVIRGSNVVDGTGRPHFQADVAIQKDRIVAVGTVEGDSRVELDGRGLVTAPGFIDPHTHADSKILTHPLAANFIMQGVTTVVAGHCGESMAPLGESCSATMVNAWEWWQDVASGTRDHPMTIRVDECNDIIAERMGFRIEWKTFGDFLGRVESAGTSVNFASFVGHNTLRVAVMSSDFRRPANAKEVEEMKHLAAEAMMEGAFGISAMFDPGPGEYAEMDELVEIARIAKEYGGCFVPHTRHTQSQMPAAAPDEHGYGIFHGPPEDVWVGRYRGLMEAIDIARQSGAKLHVAHLSNVFRIPQSHSDRLEEAMASATLDMVDAAREGGVDITFDVVASAECISAGVLLRNEFEDWLEDGTTEKLGSEEFRDAVLQAHATGKLKLQMIHTAADPYWMESFRILRCARKELEGRVVGDIARELESDPLRLLIDIITEDPETVWVQFRDERGTEAANLVFLSHELSMPCTDAEIHAAFGHDDIAALPPPTAFGIFPHYLRLAVNERKILSIEEAVRKATGLVADRMGIEDRGRIEEGTYADVVLFDKDSISEGGTFLRPSEPPSGIEAVIVNGRIVYREGRFTEEMPGMVLRHRLEPVGNHIST